MKKVSIITPTYNHEKFIQRSLEGILGQTYQDFEFIIINDGSTDRTIDIVREVKDDRIRILEQPHKGIGTALNLGFSVSVGEYETWTASDDLFYPTAIEEMVSILDTKPNVDFVYCNCEVGLMDVTGLKEIRRTPYDYDLSMEWNPVTFYDRFNIGVVWLWRRNLRIKAGETFITEPCEDYEMVTRMIEAGGNFHYHSKVLGWIRRHAGCLSENITKDYTRELIQEMQKKRDELASKVKNEKG